MQLFYSNRIEEDLIHLDADESRHCIAVLRKRKGDEIIVTDGKGGRYTAEINADKVSAVSARVKSREQVPGALPLNLHIAVSPTKNADRMEWMLEKCTEVGISSISFVQCSRSERKHINTERLRKIALSAMKQSLKYTLPDIHEMQPLPLFIKNLPQGGNRLIAWCETGKEEHILKVKGNSDEVVLLVGPEGDFTAEEVDLARSASFLPVSLGPSRLRTETAALTACVLLQLAGSSGA